MQNVIQECRRRYTVRIERDGRLLADWHQPHYAQQLSTVAQAQGDSLSSAVRLLTCGVFAAARREVAMAVIPESPAEVPQFRRNDRNPVLLPAPGGGYDEH